MRLDVEPPRNVPVAVDGHPGHRAAVDPHVRDHAARRHRLRDRAHRPALDEARRRLGPRAARRRLGRCGRHRRRAALPRGHELRPAAGRVVGARSRSGKEGSESGAASSSASSPAASSSGAPGRASRCSPTVWRLGSYSPRQSDAGATGGIRSSSASRRTCPGALDIDAEHCPVDYLDLATGCSRNFHPIFLYEFTYNLIGVGVLLLVERLIRVRPPGAVRSLHLVVHARPALRGAAAHRPLARVPRPAAELLGGRRPLRLLDGVLHLVAVHPQAPWPDAERPRPGGVAAGRSGDGRPQGTRPPASLASRG